MGKWESDEELMPVRRFPEFQDAGAWSEKAGCALFDQINDRDANSNLPALAITQEHGAIPRTMIEYHVSVTEKSAENYKVVRVGDFIISLRSFQGGIEYARYEGVCSPAYVILRLRDSHVADYFRHYFKTYRFLRILTRNIEGLRDGKMISYKQFSELMLPVPRAKEQQKIAACLSSLDAVIAAEVDRQEALRDHKRGLIRTLFPTLGQTTPSLRFPEFQGVREWQEKLLGEICDVAQGFGFPDRMQGKSSGDYPFCKVSDISRAVNENGGLVDKSTNYVDHADLKLLRAKTIPVGATVFAKIGEALRLNRRAITGVACLIDNNAVALKAKDDETASYFLFSLSQTIDMKNYCSGAIPSVNKSTLESIVVKVPGLAEQTKIAACLHSIDALIAAQRDKIDTLKAHKTGLMQQLFPSPAEVSA